MLISPSAPGWYRLARNTHRWWDGTRWTEDMIHHGRQTTVTDLRRAAVRMQWALIAFGVVGWLLYLSLVIAVGSSAAVALVLLPVAGSVAIVFGAVAGSRLVAALAPVPRPWSGGSPPGAAPPAP